MGLFDFLNASESKQPSICLTDYKFLSDDHTRFENGRPTSANNKGAWRGIRVRSSDNTTFFVTMYNMNGNHPVWGDNIQMAEKRMKLVTESNDKIVLRGYGTDVMGASFADYGLTLYKLNGSINKITLHMHDRRIDIEYKKAVSEQQAVRLDEFSDFDNFKSFIQKWNTSMPMQEKMQIALQSDTINNKGAVAYNNDNIQGAIKYFEQALNVMPNNDDALKNLKMCYLEVGNQTKAIEVQKKLNYLS